MQEKIVFVIVAALIGLPGFSEATPAISCHCFQNREFDPNQPAAADTYLLTTTFNTFQALALEIEKKSIVRAKMSGRASEYLWLRHWFAKETGLSVDEIGQKYHALGSWRELGRQEGIAGPDGLSPPEDAFSSDRQLAESIALWEMARYFGVEPGKLVELRKKGASLKEMALSLFISALTSHSAEEVFDRVHADETSWGTAARKAGITFSAVEPKMSKLGPTNHK
ncbi:MAG TPA: hypothetical protein VJ882_07460 [Desulfuromonadales bacterium]|nr:hypothetical protein [Desulfuromonadales bacterium]